MITGLLQFLITAVTSILGVLFLLRAWLFVWAMSPRHPFVQLTRKTTDWLVVPLSKIIPAHGNVDWPSLLGGLLVAFGTVLAGRLLTGMPMAPVGLIIAPFALLIRWSLEMISWGVLIWVLLSWLNPQSPMMYALGTLVEPFLRPVRRVLPNIGRFDFSPVVVILLANVLIILITPLSHGFIAL